MLTPEQANVVADELLAGSTERGRTLAQVAKVTRGPLRWVLLFLLC
jgi:hypothetical protein